METRCVEGGEGVEGARRHADREGWGRDAGSGSGGGGGGGGGVGDIGGVCGGWGGGMRRGRLDGGSEGGGRRGGGGGGGLGGVCWLIGWVEELCSDVREECAALGIEGLELCLIKRKLEVGSELG